MRLIEREKVIEAIHTHFKSEVDAIPKDADFGTLTATCDLIIDQSAKLTKIIDELPTVEPDSIKWIPCKVRKPEKSGQYLVTKRQKTGQIIRATAHYSTDFDEWSGSFKDVLAWMPLPKPYKEYSDGRND